MGRDDRPQLPRTVTDHPRRSCLALVNGVVYPAPDRPASQAILVSDGRVEAIGTTSEISVIAPPGTARVDLGGRTVLPAITDSHTHYHRAAQLEAHFLDFTALGPTSVSDVLRLVGERRASQPSEAWIQGDNLSAAALCERRLPTRLELDAVCADRPVILRTVGKHGIAANTAALAAASITADTEDPRGGRIERDASGAPSGVLHETAKLRLDATRADTVVPRIDERRRLDALEAGIGRLSRAGIAEIHEIVQSPDEMADYERLREQGRLNARVVFYVRVVEGQATLADLTRIGLRSGFGDDWLRLGGVKVSIDGSCTLHNAAIYGGYVDDPDNDGLVRVEPGDLNDLVAKATHGGLQVAVHAIGQRAVDMALDAFQASVSASASVSTEVAVATSRDLRHRLEHAYLAPLPGQLERIRDLRLVVSTQPAFLYANGDTWPAMFGAADTDRMVPMASLLDAGIAVQINTDFPNAALDPIANMRAAVERRTASGAIVGASEAVSVAQAWALATVGSAFGAFEENRRGRLDPGFLGDVVVVNDDPIASGSLDGIQVEATIVGGEIMWASAGGCI